MSVERVEINEPVEGEQMSLEDQLAQQEAENPNLVQQEEQEQPIQQEPSGQEVSDEQELILGKFKSQEDLAQAYENLEKKIGEQQQTSKEEGQQEEEAPVQQGNVSNAIQEASDAYLEKGELSEANYKALEESGIPRDFVDAYVRGQEATIESEMAEIRSTVGGQDNYNQMIEWASANLPEEDINSYDDIVSTGTPEAAKMAAKGMYARYMSETGGESMNIAKGGTSGAAIQPFNSNAQVVEAINDRRYEMDPAYRAEVERRISVSTNI
tara:strand:- start:14427 stop:15233 length:807 start_codon:yes stop_codon:yes gene_type:complete